MDTLGNELAGKPLLESMTRRDRETSLPTGTVTFLFTDVEGSTPLWEKMPEAMQVAVALHHNIRMHPTKPATPSTVLRK